MGETRTSQELNENPPDLLTCIGTDSKYGRVYVENPPRTVHGKQEPLFILRGVDPATVYTIGSYGDNAELEGSSEEFHSAVAARQVEIEAWQFANKDLMKVAD